MLSALFLLLSGAGTPKSWEKLQRPWLPSTLLPPRQREREKGEDRCRRPSPSSATSGAEQSLVSQLLNACVIKCRRETSLMVQHQNSAFSCKGAGVAPGRGTKIPDSLQSNQKMKTEQYCNRFNKDFTNGLGPKKKKKGPKS